MTQTLNVRLENRVAEIPAVLDRIERFLGEHGADPAVTQRFSLALNELLTNVVTHAYPDTATREIAVAVTVRDRRIVCELSDDGAPFDPLAVAAPDTDAALEDRPVGGLGLHLVRQSIPELAYRREAGCNVLRLSGPLEGRDDGA